MVTITPTTPQIPLYLNSISISSSHTHTHKPSLLDKKKILTQYTHTQEQAQLSFLLLDSTLAHQHKHTHHSILSFSLGSHMEQKKKDPRE